MDVLEIGLVLTGLLFLFLGAGLWVALSLFAVGVLALDVFSDARTGPVVATTAWASLSTWSLTPLPLFIWMSEILFRSRLSEDMFAGLAPWLTSCPAVYYMPIFWDAAFLPPFRGVPRRRPSRRLAACRSRNYASGAIPTNRYSVRWPVRGRCANSKIPPSIILIVYGVSAELSIARLFIAGILPGAMLVVLFMGFVGVRAMIDKEDTPPAGRARRSPTSSARRGV